MNKFRLTLSSDSPFSKYHMSDYVNYVCILVIQYLNIFQKYMFEFSWTNSEWTYRNYDLNANEFDQSVLWPFQVLLICLDVKVICYRTEMTNQLPTLKLQKSILSSYHQVRWVFVLWWYMTKRWIWHFWPSAQICNVPTKQKFKIVCW